MSPLVKPLCELLRNGTEPKAIAKILGLTDRRFRRLRSRAMENGLLSPDAPNIPTKREVIQAAQRRRRKGIYIADEEKPLYVRVRELRETMLPREICKVIGINREQYKSAIDYARHLFGPMPVRAGWDRKRIAGVKKPDAMPSDPWARLPANAFSDHPNARD